MSIKETEIRNKGRSVWVPSTTIGDRTVIVTGRWIRMAVVKDEEAVEGAIVEDPHSFITKLKSAELKADVFTFPQRPPEVTPKYDYHWELDNWAAARTTCFKDWWESLPQESRKNVRRARRRGVVVKAIPFDDNLVAGVHRIYNHTPIRDGRRFWHYGKDLETVRRGLGSYLDRSTFIGAYWNDELIGFIKMVYVDRVAVLFHIIAMNEHYDKRPMNALIAKAVELCEQNISHLIYGRFLYGNKRRSSLLEFKRRNGFEQIDFPRYYIPLTLKGTLFVWLRLYRGFSGLLPEPILNAVLSCRAWYYNKLSGSLQRNNLPV